MKKKFIVKKDEGVVVAIGSFCTFDLAKDLGILHKNDDVLEMLDIINPYLIQDTFKGVAKLSPEDEWDESKGKDIAEAKMLIKYLKAKKKVLDKNLADIDIVGQALAELADLQGELIEEVSKVLK